MSYEDLGKARNYLKRADAKITFYREKLRLALEEPSSDSSDGDRSRSRSPFVVRILSRSFHGSSGHSHSRFDNRTGDEDVLCGRVSVVRNSAHVIPVKRLFNVVMVGTFSVRITSNNKRKINQSGSH